METFSALLAIGAGNSAVPGKFPTQRPVTRSFDVFFDVRRNKQLSKQSWGWWFETLSPSLWRHRNVQHQHQHHRHRTSSCDYIWIFLDFMMIFSCWWFILTSIRLDCDWNFISIWVKYVWVKGKCLSGNMKLTGTKFHWWTAMCHSRFKNGAFYN